MRLLLFAVLATLASQGPSPSSRTVAKPQQTDSGARKQQPETDQRGTPQSPLVVKATKTKEEAAQEAKDREDKAANERELVEFTGILALIGLLQLGVFAFQAAQLKSTVDRMREAEKITSASVVEMQRVADAAQRSADVAERTLVITQRASVFGKGFRSAPNSFDLGIKEYVFWVEWENFGPTPATDVRSWIEIKAFPGGAKEDPVFAHDSSGAATVLGPHSNANSGFKTVPIRAMVDLWNKKTEIFVWARAEYRDVLNPEIIHHHEQCARLGLIHEPSTVPPPNHTPYVTFNSYGPQNTTA